MNAAGWSAAALVVGALLAALGTRYTAREGKKAQEYSAALQAPEAISSGYARLNDDLWRSISDLQSRLGKAESRVDALEAEADAQQRWRHASIAFIRALMAYIDRLRTNPATAGPPPAPPAELAEDLRWEP